LCNPAYLQIGNKSAFLLCPYFSKKMESGQIKMAAPFFSVHVQGGFIHHANFNQKLNADCVYPARS
jgi:hypothetical protein